MSAQNMCKAASKGKHTSIILVATSDLRERRHVLHRDTRALDIWGHARVFVTRMLSGRIFEVPTLGRIQH